jgi:hypothetical protein
MMRRWRQELGKHLGLPGLLLAPPSAAPDVDCHCSAGIGALRKRKPLDCGRARCGLCHSEKWMPRDRLNERRRAIEFDFRAG